MTNLILFGGRGTRLWPISRTLMPKQFVKLCSNKSLFQLTVQRNSKLYESQFIVSNSEQYFLIQDQLEENSEFRIQNSLLNISLKEVKIEILSRRKPIREFLPYKYIDISIKKLAKLIKNIIGFKGDLVFYTNKPNGAMLKLTNLSKLHRLGLKYKIKLEEELKLCINGI